MKMQDKLSYNKSVLNIAVKAGFIQKEVSESILSAIRLDKSLGRESNIGTYLINIGGLTEEQLSEILIRKDVLAPESTCSRTIYVLLALFLGNLGIHDFYAGHAIRAILLLFAFFLTMGFSAFLTTPLVVIELILEEKDGQGRKMNW